MQNEIIEERRLGIEIAVRNLASIALPVRHLEGKFDHDKSYEITKVATRNLNKVIDVTIIRSGSRKWPN